MISGHKKTKKPCNPIYTLLHNKLQNSKQFTKQNACVTDTYNAKQPHCTILTEIRRSQSLA